MKALILALAFTATAAWADVTPNLVYTTCNPAPEGTSIGSSWTGFTTTNSTGGNTANAAGNVTGYNINNCTFYFGYNPGTVAYTYAINQALTGTGIKVAGYNYSWEINNLNYDDRQAGVDTLTARVLTFFPDNINVRRTDTWIYNTKFDWTTFSGTVNYNNPGSPSEFGNMRVEFSGMDSGFWAGYYGPQVRNIDISLNYTATTVDPCVNNPLSSPSCPGYQQAYHDQQCAINPLYATTCPGYQQAYHDQQCAINPLYATSCPGYQQAYFDQQCTANPLYNNQCPGYQQAYFDQQCGLDPFYSNQCPGYQQAYYDQQCSINPLYDSGCANHDIVRAATQPPAMTLESTILVQVAENTSESAATSATSPTSVSPAAVISVIDPAPVPAAPAASARSGQRQTSKDKDKDKAKAAEKKKTDQAMARVIPRGLTGAAAAQAAAEKADEAVAAAATATTIEAQQAAQSLVLGLMGFNPAFTAYQNAMVPDVNAASMARQYNQPTVDNRSALRQLSGASDRMHQDMVDQQYGRMP